MNSLWKNLYDHFKDRGYGGLFIFSLLLCTGVVVLTAKILEDVQRGYLMYWLPVFALFAGAFAFSILRRFRSRPVEPWKDRPLSGDELRKARSKLTSHRNWKKS